jgi:TolB-like protein/Tfp pilus assembly protein PilF
LASQGISFFAELKRRNVYRVGIAYVVVAWLALQALDIVVPIMRAPEWFSQLVLILLVIGLPFALIFAWAFEMTPEGLKREKDVDRTESITQETGQRISRLTTTVLVLAVGFLLIDKFFLGDPVPASDTDAITPAETVVAEETTPSIAVLPFANMSADENSTYFSDGLADTLLHMLAQIREIRVAARTSSFQFRDQNTDITEIAAALNVGTILEGSVQRAGNKIRVTAQLIEAETGFHLWSGNYDRDLDDIFAIQDEIANEVVAALKVSLLGEAADVLAHDQTDSLEAYTAYLLGINDFDQGSFAGLESAEQRLLEAVRLDPDYAAAWSKLAVTYSQMADIGLGSETDLYQQAHDAASRAIDLDETSAEAIAVLGIVELSNGDDEAAEQLLSRSIELSPSDMTARSYYAILLDRRGEARRATEVLRESLLFDPLSTDIYNTLSFHYRQMGDYGAATDAASKLREIVPFSPIPYYRQAEIEFSRGEWVAAIDQTKKALEFDPDDPELAFEIGRYYLDMELPTQAKQWFDRTVEINPEHPVSRVAPLALALYHDDISPEDVRLARQLLVEEFDNRQGSRGIVLQTIWTDARRNGSIDDAVDLMRDHFPEFFADDGDPSKWDSSTLFFVGAILMDAGQESRATMVFKDWMERSGESSESRGFSYGLVWALAAMQDRDGLIQELARLQDSDLFITEWRRKILTLPAFDFVRDEPEFKAVVARYQAVADEQRLLLEQ